MTTVLAGLLLGVVGSGHCGAMCGPLVLLATPRAGAAGDTGGHVSTARLAWHAALYHGGRIATYVVLGLAAGLAGSAVARVGLGRALAVAAGAALLVQALTASRLVRGRLRGAGAVSGRVTRALGSAGGWMRTHRVQGPVVFGALNGLLPCGLLYAALTAAAGLGEMTQAVTFMAAFGAGTTPLLAVIGVASGTLAPYVPLTVRRAAPVALALVGVLLIVRGVTVPHAAHGVVHDAPASVEAPAHHEHPGAPGQPALR
jgi:uncharacterized protein